MFSARHAQRVVLAQDSRAMPTFDSMTDLAQAVRALRSLSSNQSSSPFAQYLSPRFTRCIDLFFSWRLSFLGGFLLRFSATTVAPVCLGVESHLSVVRPSRPDHTSLSCPTLAARGAMPRSFREKIPQVEDRYDLYLETKSWEKAAEAAARLKDPR